SEQALAVAARNGPSPDAGRFRWAGWVARLTSGNADADRDDGQRVHARVTALFTFLNRLDERVMLRHWRVGEPLLYRRRVRLEPWIVQGLDAAARHPSSAPGALDVRAIVAAALAAAATGQRRLADACVARIRMAGPGLNAVWRQIAALEERPGEGPLPVAGVTPLACVLDAALVARSLGAVADADMASLQGLARATLERLAPDRQGRAALTARDAVGTWYEVLVLTLAAFAGDLATMREVLERAPMRIAQQFAPDGAQPDAAMGDDPLGGAVRNLEGWACLAWMARPLGHDLWTGRTGDGRSPAVGLAHLAQHAARLPALDGRRRRTEALVRLAAPSAGTRGAPFAEPDPGSCLPPFLTLLLAAAAEPRYGSGGA
ncbi:MAG: alginate lyase family protein, partial [Alphaproteobacteria bacterium]|nr:alginate lyase family protein [Alphaproteobacteria bacterium]